MRVLHIGKYYPPAVGGMETFLYDLATFQARQGLDVCVLAHEDRPWRPRWFTAAGTCSGGTGNRASEPERAWERREPIRSEVPVSSSDTGDFNGSEDLPGVQVRRAAILGRLAFTPIAPGFPLALARLLTQFRPHVVHVHMPNPSAFALLALPTMQARSLRSVDEYRPALVLHWHADVLTQGSFGLKLLHPVYRILEQALLRRADAVVATSQPYLEASAALAPHGPKCRVIGLGLDPQRLGTPSFQEVAAARASVLGPGGQNSPSGQSGRAFLVLSAGRFSHYKGFDVLVRAAGLLPETARVFIAGDGPLRPDLARLVRELGLDGRVVLPGALPHGTLHALMAGCDCFCLSSVTRAEAFGLVLAEAMRFGRPLVSSRLPGSGLGLVNQEGVTGLAFKPGDPAALARAVVRLMEDPGLAGRLGRAGRQRFAEHLHISPVGHKIEALYREVSQISEVSEVSEISAQATTRPRTDGSRAR